ncbi:MAG TPA: hypothetical protein VKR31_17485 [Rhizomicrobium sp.]|nr:hypothetical protein [Rhizomicrobium sp.]
MRSLPKIAFATSMLASLAIGVSDASAGVTVGVAVGAPVVKVRVGDACVQPYRLRPAYCGYPLYGRPVFVDGAWYRGPIYVREVRGVRYLWFRGRWERERLAWRR